VEELYALGHSGSEALQPQLDLNHVLSERQSCRPERGRSVKSLPIRSSRTIFYLRVARLITHTRFKVVFV